MSYSRHGRRWALFAILAIVLMLPACFLLSTQKLYMTMDEQQRVTTPGVPRQDVSPAENAYGSQSPPDNANAEAYSHYQDNAFLTVANHPRSTFSIDVDTASYSNVRRFLNEGKLPPPDAVRIAELVNYFPYDYPTPTDGHPVGLSVSKGPCHWNNRHQVVCIMLKAKSYTADDMPPRNLVFLVDVSGSMADEMRLPLVKASLRLLVEQLNPRDRVSIVTYAGDASVRLPSTPGSEKRKILRAIEELQAGGSTNGAGGIERAYEQAHAGFISGGVNRVILATDGDFNVGIASEGDLVRFIEKKRDSGIFLTILGYGMGNLKDSTMQKLAHHGDGHYAYVDSLEEARKIFVEQGGALACVAKDVKLQVEFNPAKVSAYRLIGYENRLLKNEDFKDDKKDAGDMGSGHAVTALYEIVPPGEKIGSASVDPLKYQKPDRQEAMRSDEYLTVKLRYKQPDGGASKEQSIVLPECWVGGNVLPPVVSGVDWVWAANVASFGMLLRDSPYKGNATYEQVLMWAQTCLQQKSDPHREEFVKLVRAAMALDKATTHLSYERLSGSIGP